MFVCACVCVYVCLCVWVCVYECVCVSVCGVCERERESVCVCVCVLCVYVVCVLCVYVCCVCMCVVCMSVLPCSIMQCWGYMVPRALCLWGKHRATLYLPPHPRLLFWNRRATHTSFLFSGNLVKESDQVHICYWQEDQELALTGLGYQPRISEFLSQEM